MCVMVDGLKDNRLEQRMSAVAPRLCDVAGSRIIAYGTEWKFWWREASAFSCRFCSPLKP